DAQGVEIGAQPRCLQAIPAIKTGNERLPGGTIMQESFESRIKMQVSEQEAPVGAQVEVRAHEIHGSFQFLVLDMGRASKRVPQAVRTRRCRRRVVCLQGSFMVLQSRHGFAQWVRTMGSFPQSTRERVKQKVLPTPG